MMNPKTLQVPARTPVLRQKGDGKLLQPPMGPQLVKLSRSETDGVFEMIEIEVVPGGGPPLHIHPAFDEAFYVLEGVLTVRLGEETVELRAGGSLVVPAGVVHTWGNRTRAPVRILQITALGAMEEMLEAFAARPLLGFEEMSQLAELHGTTVVGPPL